MILGVISRREFILRYLSAGVLFGFWFVPMACGTKKSFEEKGVNNKTDYPCSDLSGLSEGELEKRKKLGYVRETPDPEKQCNKCKLFLPPKVDKICGGCLLFKGPVGSTGTCLYWAPLL